MQHLQLGLFLLSLQSLDSVVVVFNQFIEIDYTKHLRVHLQPIERVHIVLNLIPHTMQEPHRSLTLLGSRINLMPFGPCMTFVNFFILIFDFFLLWKCIDLSYDFLLYLE